MSHFKGKVDVAPSVLYHLKMDGNKQTTILPQLNQESFNMADTAIDFPERALREREVEQIVGLKKSRIRELEAAGEFPKRRIFGARSVRWLRSEILEYIQTRPAA